MKKIINVLTVALNHQEIKNFPQRIKKIKLGRNKFSTR